MGNIPGSIPRSPRAGRDSWGLRECARVRLRVICLKPANDFDFSHREAVVALRAGSPPGLHRRGRGAFRWPWGPTRSVKGGFRPVDFAQTVRLTRRSSSPRGWADGVIPRAHLPKFFSGIQKRPADSARCGLPRSFIFSAVTGPMR